MLLNPLCDKEELEFENARLREDLAQLKRSKIVHIKQK